MARMSREFALVLLGSGILTAGYFLRPDEASEVAFQDRADKQAQQQVAGNRQAGATHGHMFVWVHSGGGFSGTWPAATANISRGGFGAFGHASS